MTVTTGKLEAKITVPTGGWDITCTDDAGGPTVINLAVGAYYLSSGDTLNDFLADLLTAINAGMGETWTLVGSYAEAGTGLATIGCSGATCTVVFTDIEIRNLLGFTGNLAASTSYTSPHSAQGLWLPDGPPKSLAGIDDPMEESDETVTAPPGSNVYVNRLTYGRRSYHEGVIWQGISRAKTRVIGEIVGNESIQSYWQDVIQGDIDYLGPETRIYPDAGDDGTYQTVWMMGWPRMVPETTRDGYIHVWRIEFPKLLVE